MFQIKQMRVKRNMNQQQAADAVGMPVRRYGSYEREERPISLEDAISIADAFECTLDDLAGRDFPQALDVAPDERALVDDYRQCTPREKQILRLTAETMADDGQAKNNPLAVSSVA